MTQDEARNQLERIFQEFFESNPVVKHMQKLEKLMTYDWDEDIAIAYIEEMKKRLL